MADFTWTDPPPKGRGAKGAWADRLAPLHERPGEWGCFGETCYSEVTRINNGRYSKVDAGQYEARGVAIAGRTGKCTLYVRYIGAT